MAQWHGYLAIEDLALNATQRAAILASINALGPGSDPQPAHLNHWRTRLDGMARIYEALFNEDTLTVASIKQFLANATGVNPTTIAHATSTVSFTPGGITQVVVYSVAGVDRLRFAAFGGVGSTWLESQAEVRAYLVLHISEWDAEL